MFIHVNRAVEFYLHSTFDRYTCHKAGVKNPSCRIRLINQTVPCLKTSEGVTAFNCCNVGDIIDVIAVTTIPCLMNVPHQALVKKYNKYKMLVNCSDIRGIKHHNIGK